MSKGEVRNRSKESARTWIPNHSIFAIRNSEFVWRRGSIVAASRLLPLEERRRRAEPEHISFVARPPPSMVEAIPRRDTTGFGPVPSESAINAENLDRKSFGNAGKRGGVDGNAGRNRVDQGGFSYQPTKSSSRLIRKWGG